MKPATAKDFRPTQDWLLVKELSQEDKHGLIIRPDYYGLSHETLLGEVIAAGPGIKKGMRIIPNDIFPGQLIGFKRKIRELMQFVEDGVTVKYLLVRGRDVDFIGEFQGFEPA